MLGVISTITKAYGGVESRASGSSGVERVLTNGHEGNLYNITHRPESSEWVAAVLGLEKPPNNEHAIWSR